MFEKGQDVLRRTVLMQGHCFYIVVIFTEYEYVPVLYEILHVEVIDEQWIPEFGILHSFVQRETWKMLNCK